MRKELTIATPCFNEAEALPAYFERMDYAREALERCDWDVRMMFVDDGSTDMTHALLERYAARRPSVILRHAHNLGFGAAVKSALAAASSDWIIFMDADSNYDQALVLQIAEMLEEGTDIVNVSVLAPGGRPAYGWHRLFFSLGASLVYRLFFPWTMRGIYTPTCGVRGYRRERALDIFPHHDNFAASAEILVRGALRGYRIRELPASNFPRRTGKSKMRFLSVSLAHLKIAVSARMNRLPLPVSPQEHLRWAGFENLPENI